MVRITLLDCHFIHSFASSIRDNKTMAAFLQFLLKGVDYKSIVCLVLKSMMSEVIVGHCTTIGIDSRSNEKELC